MKTLDTVSENTQPPEGPDLREDGSLDVHSLFPTLQGEGPFAGTPAVFVRLAGCNLGGVLGVQGGTGSCPRCDTDYTSTRKRYTPEELCRAVEDLAGDSIRLVVLTGGEPLRQNLSPFLYTMLGRAFSVQIETNGALYQELIWVLGLTVVCSPKTPKVNEKMARRVDHWKYVLKAGEASDVDGLPTRTMGGVLGVARPPDNSHLRRSWRDNVFVQPLDEGDPVQNSLNAQECVRSCMKYGYRLSYQLHKVLGLE